MVNCDVCFDEVRCVKASAGWVVSLNNTPVRECGKGEYEESKKCYLCSPLCESCSNSLSCSSCLSPNYLR